MNFKKDDLNNNTREKLSDKSEKIHIESFNAEDAGLKYVAFKVSMAYFIVGGIWVSFSEGIFNKFGESKELIERIHIMKGWAYIITSTLILFFLISEYAKRSKVWSRKLKENYEEIQATYGQLLAAEEELRAQYDELHEKQEMIEKSEERYKLALEGANDAIWEIDLLTKEIFYSDKFTDITGYDESTITNLKELMEIIVDEDKNTALCDFKNHIEGKKPYYQSNIKIAYNGGGHRWVLIRGKCMRDKKGIATKMSGSVTDVSSQKTSEQEINKLQYYDALTEIPNRKLFIATLENEIIIARNSEVKHAILFIDLDNFKEINDTLGHNYGDRLLKTVATTLKDAIREDDFISRVGGDEFFILMRNINDCSEVTSICEKLLFSLNYELNIDGKHVYTSASVGITIFPEDATETSALLINADTAMYSAKYSGKSKYSFFNKSMSDIVIRRSHIEKGLRYALKNNELEIYYQPQIDIINNKVKGFEALLRWNSTELGSLSPTEFIPVAEQCGLIIPIGDWIMRNVYLQNNIWKSKGYEYDTIAINLSAIQLENDKFGDTLKRILEETKTNTKFVELEITESILMKDLGKSIKLLTEIRDLGINIALDDFGTGYSSLSYLKQLPINTLKIDKTFIDNIATNTREKAIVDGIIQLAQKIGLDVIAEGVETKEQIQLLKQMGCNQIQGYYFSKPLSAYETEEKFLKNSEIESYE